MRIQINVLSLHYTKTTEEMRTEQNGISYKQSEEHGLGSCHGCIAYAILSEADEVIEFRDALCRKLSKESGNDCEDAIWKEATDEL